MKTQVIQLDPHDDGTSVRDKMSWAKSPRILLVYPRRSRILARTLDLRLLQRHAATLGEQLAIVPHLKKFVWLHANWASRFIKRQPSPNGEPGQPNPPPKRRFVAHHAPTCGRCAAK